MFPKENRLARRDFAVLKKTGKLFSSQTFGVLVDDRSDSADLQIGIVVSTKVEKSAVLRNSIKRRLRRLLLPHLKSNKGRRLVFLTKKTLAQTPDVELARELAIFFKNLNKERSK